MYSNQQTERHRLHRQLIEVEGRPCTTPNCPTPYDRREVHRIIPGSEYTETSVLVRCFNCHHYLDHPSSKFRVGDRVVLNGRTPTRIDLARRSPRTIIRIKYNPKRKCNYYLLGANCRGTNSGNGNPLEGYSDYQFRSYMLLPYTPRRYHFIRPYNRKKEWRQVGTELCPECKTKARGYLDTISSDEQEDNQTRQGVVECLD